MAGLVLPKVECIESKDNFGHFVVEPLEKGFAVTLGNAMRRVLLSYLPGAAITRVKIEGVQHELSTVPNVKEDVTDLLLNVKAVRLKSTSGQASKLVLDAEGAGEVSARDIQPSADFDIINPDLHLATLDSNDARLYIEFDAEVGEGFRKAEGGDNLPIGVIPVDALFTPMRKVNFTVEPIRFGQESSRERLHIEIWTDGTVTPGEAFSRGAGILIKQLTPLAEFVAMSLAEAIKEPVKPAIPEDKYNKPIEELNLSVRTLNCLRRAGITTVGEVVSRGLGELQTLRNFGKKSQVEVEERLSEIGLTLGPPPDAEQGEVTDETSDTDEQT